MSAKKPRSPEFKLKVVLAALSGKETVSEICQRFEVAESLVHKWRKQLLEHGDQIFSISSDKGNDRQ
jgi:transposase-like protein